MQKNKWKRCRTLFSLLLALTLCVSMLSGTALAADTAQNDGMITTSDDVTVRAEEDTGIGAASDDGTVQVTDDGTIQARENDGIVTASDDGTDESANDGTDETTDDGTDETGDGSEPAGTVLPSEGGTLPEGSYYLNEDVTLEAYISVAAGTEVTIDLNGYTLSAPDDVKYVLYVAGTLTLEDNSTAGSGKVMGGSSYRVYITSGGEFNLVSGELNGSSTSGSGVYVYGSSSVRGVFNMSGGKITGNTAASDGGGVYVYRSTFTMTGGEISGNSAGTHGGGVYMSSSSSSLHIFNMSGGTITGNTAGSAGDGVYFAGTMNLSGTPVITGNTANGVTNNLYCYHKLTLTGEFSEGADIGVTMRTTPAAAGAVNISDAETETSYYQSAAQYFTSDSTLYVIRLNEEDGYLELFDDLTPAITAQPQDVLAMVGDSAVVSVEISDQDDAVLSYQWYSCSGKTADGGTEISGAMQASYTVPTDTAGVVYYYCVINLVKTDGTVERSGSVASDTARVTVAEEGEYAASVSDGTETTYYYLIEDAFSYANSLDSAAAVTLLSDSVIYKTLEVSVGQEMTLDLSGYTLDVASGAYISVLTVYGTLTLTDSSEAGGGKVTGGAGTSNSASYY